MKSNAKATPKVERREERYTGPRRAKRLRTNTQPTSRHAPAVRNGTVAALRAHWSDHPKRGAAKYGPPPISGGSTGEPAARMTLRRRKDAYSAQNGFYHRTARQCRQLRRMEHLDRRDAIHRGSVTA